MSRVIKKSLLSFIIITIFSCAMAVCYGASIGLSVGYSSITVGGSTTLTIKGNDAIGRVSITSSNPNVVAVSSSSAWLEGSTSVTLTTKSVGTSVITVSGTLSNSAGTAENNLSKSITITSKAVYIDTRSKNNNLSAISVEGFQLNEAFNSGTTSYTLTVPYDVEIVQVNAITEDSAARYSVDGNGGLNYGENTVNVIVSAENGATKTYSIIVTRQKDPKDINADLALLTVLNGRFRESFTKEITTYICEDLSVDVEKLDIVAIPEVEEAKVEIIGNEKLEVGTNKIIIKVTSKDGSSVKEYDIVVYKSDEMLALKQVEEPEQKTILEIIREYSWEIALGLVVILQFILIVYLLTKDKNKPDYIEREVRDIEKNYTNITIDEDDEVTDTEITEDVLKNSDVNEIKTRRHRSN